jgi:general secretion pathway protein E
MNPRLPFAFARDAGLTLLETDGHYLWSARADVQPAAWAEVLRVYGAPARVEIQTATEYEKALAQHYASRDGAAGVVEDAGQALDLERMIEALPTVADLLESADDAPVIRMINALLTQALRDQASDIHIEAFDGYSLVRFRLDGSLRDIVRPHQALHAAMVSRIKIMASLDIAEQRLPQDGRISLRLAGRPVDVRVSTLPTRHGERVVLRLLDQNAARLDLAALGMAVDTLQAVDRLILQPHGILLITGPTGCGKTTTLYAALSRLNAASSNIMTVEDPVEYDLPGIGQTQVNPLIEMGFARALRAILRQDPDVVMIGEIRDQETARIAVQASLTGHLVLATLHTNDAVSAVTRLVDMGIEPFLLASSLLAVMAQRLVRQLCPACRQLQRDTSHVGDHFLAAGCEQCGQTGYRGRLGLHVLLEIDAGMQRLIHRGASEQLLQKHAVAQGMRSLREEGLSRLSSGETSLEEVLRVTRS